MSAWLASASPSGSYSSRAAKPSWMPGVGITRTGLAAWRAACSATGMMLLLLGRMTTCSPGAASMAASRSAVDGFIDWPPLTTWWTPRDRKMRRMPVAGADRHHRAPHRLGRGLGLGLGAGRLPYPPLLFDLLPEVGDPDAAGPAGLQGRLDGGADVVGVDVAVPQAFAAHHDDRVAQTRPHLAEGREGLVGRFQQVHDLVAQARRLATPVRGRRRQPSGARGRPGRPALAASGSGRPAATWRKASSSRTNPAPPASTTPAVLSTGSSSGVRARAVGRPAGAASSTASRSGALGRRRGRAVGGGSRPRSGSSPPPGSGRPGRRRRRRAGQAVGEHAGVDSVVLRTASARPLRICDRITPELPLAPMSDP